MLGDSFLLHSGAVWAAFRVQFWLLSGRASAAVLGQFPAAILVQFLVYFWYSFGYFPVLWRLGGSFLLHSGATFAVFLVKSLLLSGTDFATGISTMRLRYRSVLATTCAITGLAAIFAAYAPLSPSSSGSLSLRRPFSEYCNGHATF